MTRAAAALLLVVAAGCGDPKTSDSSATVSVPVVVGSAAPAATTPAGSIATGTVPCTVGALWDECAVIKRIEQQGLVPRLDTTSSVRAAGFTIPGKRVMLGRGELVFFLYADTLQRARDTGALDTLTAAPRGQGGNWTSTPTLVVSRNVAVVLLTRETNVRIRITDAFTAGLPALEKK